MDIDVLVDLINEKINIPFLNEKQERILIKAVLLMVLSLFPYNDGKKNPGISD